MPRLKLSVLSLRYSSWSMRAWLALEHAGADFETETVGLPDVERRATAGEEVASLLTFAVTSRSERRAYGSVHGLFPVLRVDGVPIHESLAICEYAAESFPDAGLWPREILTRARARAVCCEMVSGFANIRGTLSSHLFGRVPQFEPGAEAKREIARVFEIWSECLERSGGPFLFGQFGIPDIMYFPMLGRFRTYGVPVPDPLNAYATALECFPAVRSLIERARTAPRIPVYDEYLRRLDGDPDAALGAKPFPA